MNTYFETETVKRSSDMKLIGAVINFSILWKSLNKHLISISKLRFTKVDIY